MKIYLYYDKITKVYKSNEFSKKPDKYPNCECLEMENEDWKAFIDTNPEIIKIEEGELKSEKRIRTLEELKNKALNSRKAYLKITGLEWSDDWDSCPQNIKDKRALLRTEKVELEAIKTKEELEQWQLTKD